MVDQSSYHTHMQMHHIHMHHTYTRQTSICVTLAQICIACTLPQTHTSQTARTRTYTHTLHVIEYNIMMQIYMKEL